MIVAGFGGQGVMITGRLLGQVACDNGKEAMFLPRYGPEQRGGTASCTVILSDEEVGSPIVGQADSIMAFNQPSLNRFVGSLKKGGTLFVNSNLCKVDDLEGDMEIVALPIDEMAKDLGHSRVANIIMLGAFAKKTGLFTKEELLKSVRKLLGKKKDLIPLNEKAVEVGMNAIEDR